MTGTIVYFSLVSIAGTLKHQQIAKICVTCNNLINIITCFTKHDMSHNDFCLPCKQWPIIHGKNVCMFISLVPNTNWTIRTRAQNLMLCVTVERHAVYSYKAIQAKVYHRRYLKTNEGGKSFLHNMKNAFQ